MTTAITIGMIIIYVAIMMGIGVYTARQTRSVSDFVLGGHSVGSWLTAFAYGTSYFSAVGILRKALELQRTESRSRCDRLYLSDSLYRIGVQRSVPSV